MRMRNAGLVAATVFAAAGCAAGAKQTAATLPTAAACSDVNDLQQEVAQLYDPGRIQQASPLYIKHFLARALVPRYLQGAQLYVAAEPGVSRPYLEHVLACYAASPGPAHPNDPLAAEHIQSLRVRAQGSQFVIDVIGADREAGHEIWKRAKALLQPGSQVRVQQLSAANAHRAQL